MGGLGPSIGATEVLLIGIILLIFVGPKDLPLLMRRVGQFMGKARGMAADFRASFDEMARQSELDELRKEVEALRTGNLAKPLGAETEAAFRQISDDLNKPVVPTSYGASDPPAPAAPPAIAAPAETKAAAPKTAAPRSATAKPKTSAAVKSTAAKPKAKPAAKSKPKAASATSAPAKAVAEKPAKSAPRRKPAAKKTPEAGS
ncbi:MAG: sec-independent protein translocase protein TatB [Brevundimonas sp.]|jgi:sec-independent protein translocase protein TatB|uniref:Sec-independent protein translocase protein TatB n=1 Tax=Brevundimonas sp. TaxID=1871086 RepID=UPI0039E3883D